MAIVIPCSQAKFSKTVEVQKCLEVSYAPFSQLMYSLLYVGGIESNPIRYGTEPAARLLIL